MKVRETEILGKFLLCNTVIFILAATDTILVRRLANTGKGEKPVLEKPAVNVTGFKTLIKTVFSMLQSNIKLTNFQVQKVKMETSILLLVILK